MQKSFSFEMLIFPLFFLCIATHAQTYKNRMAPEVSYSPELHTSDSLYPLTHVTDHAVLKYIESNGYSLGEMITSKSVKGSNTKDLFEKSSAYQSLANSVGLQSLVHDPKTDQLPKDLAPHQGLVPDLVRSLRNFEDKGKRSDKDLKGGYFIRHLSNNSHYPYLVEADGDEPRHFDHRWLKSQFSSFNLVGVVNRLDRKDFDPDSCGELRFIYRLSYRSQKSNSTLPFFINVVRKYPQLPDCSVYANAWMLPASLSKTLRENPSQAATLFGQHLQKSALTSHLLKQVEINFQSLRFTSGYMHDFGGQAMYMLQVFKPSGENLEATPLENTPDVLAIKNNPDLLEKFVAFLKDEENLRALDNGTLVIEFDPKFLAKLSLSWSTLGRSRSANKPYTELFKNRTELLKTIDISKLQFIKSHEGLVERLNNLTCMGCHQSGGTAGFHFLGEADKNFSHGFNRQELTLSAHAYAEIPRRQHYTRLVAEKETPQTFRPHSTFNEAIWAQNSRPQHIPLKSGHLCLLNQSHFSNAPSCGPGLVCKNTANVKSPGTTLFGECVKIDNESALAGSACWSGDITENLTIPENRKEALAYNLFAFRDKWRLTGSLPKSSKHKCVLPQSGAPLGRSSRACSLKEENFDLAKLESGKIPEELCANQGGNGFDLCAASGDSGACLESRVVRAMLDTCYPGKFCREDYICQKIPEYHKISDAHYGTIRNGRRVNQSKPSAINKEFIHQAHANNIGFCVPTYFLFNMRADGHPSPVTGLPPGQPRVDRSQPLRGYR